MNLIYILLTAVALLVLRSVYQASKLGHELLENRKLKDQAEMEPLARQKEQQLNNILQLDEQRKKYEADYWRASSEPKPPHDDNSAG